MNKYIIYSDGSCKGAVKKRGGWAAIICDESGKIINELWGGKTNTTNQRMEIMGVLEGLKSIDKASNIVIISDSQYVINTINNGWLSKILLNPDGFSNTDLWKQMAHLLLFHNVTLMWTKGHASNFMNNKADKLAQFAANVLNLPEDEYTYNGKEDWKSLVSQLETRRSNGIDPGQENGTILYSLG